MSHLAEGDLLFYGEISAALAKVPSRIQAGDVYITPFTSQIVWYEVLGDECEGQVLVRAYSRSLKQGEYDYVAPSHLVARVTRRLFERARAQGFRTVRACN